MALKLKIGPALEPVDLTTVKDHLRVDSDDDNGLITSLITVARRYAEKYQNYAYITQTWELWLDGWPDANYLKIPLPPLQSITAIKYYDTANKEAPFEDSKYFVDTKNEPGRIVLAYGKTWPTATLRPANGIYIEFKAGYGDAANNVPEEIKQAIKMIVGDMYEHRENTIIGDQGYEPPFAAKVLLGLDRVIPT